MSESILHQVKAEITKAKREAVKKKLKEIYTEYLKTQEVLQGMEQQMVDLVASIGDKEENIKELFAS